MIPNSDLREQDKSFVHPWHPFDYYREAGPSFMVEGKGCYLFDSDGRKYLDAVGGLWCTNIGAGRREMADAIAEQVLKLSYGNPFGNLSNEPAARLSAKLAELSPAHLNHVYYGCGGSDVLDTAVRFIQYYQNCRGKHRKKHLISRKLAYHGTTYATMSLGSIPTNRDAEWDFITDKVHHLSAPYHYRNCPEDVSEAEFTQSLVSEFESKIDQLGGPDCVAAFFAEPVMGGGGVIPPPQGYLQRMFEVCRANDILFVADEVVTGFGRLGHWFASEGEFGIQPDIIATAKGLTSGYQALGAGFLSDAIWDVLSEPGSGRMLTNGFTYSGHTVSCAAALKNIEIFEREDILANVHSVGKYFEEQIKTLADLDIVGDVRGIKFMMGIEYVSDKKTKQLFPPAVGIGSRITKETLSRGLVARPAYHLNILSPALIMTREDVDFCVKTLRDSIEATMVDLKEEGLWKH